MDFNAKVLFSLHLFAFIITALSLDDATQKNSTEESPTRRVWEEHWTFFLVVIILLAISLVLGILMCSCLKICSLRKKQPDALIVRKTNANSSAPHQEAQTVSEDKGWIIPLEQVVTTEA